MLASIDDRYLNVHIRVNTNTEMVRYIPGASGTTEKTTPASVTCMTIRRCNMVELPWFSDAVTARQPVNDHVLLAKLAHAVTVEMLGQLVKHVYSVRLNGDGNPHIGANDRRVVVVIHGAFLSYQKLRGHPLHRFGGADASYSSTLISGTLRGQ